MDMSKLRAKDREAERQQEIEWVLTALREDLNKMPLETIKYLRVSNRILMIGR
jgi:hypothetical protein